MPPGIVEWGTTPKDFFESKVAMMWTTTGNLTNVEDNAKFDFGVAMLPASKQRGSPTGGGNFYIFKKSTPAQQRGGVQVHQVGDGAASAPRSGASTPATSPCAPDAWDTPAMKQYVAGLPAGGRRARPAAVSRRPSCRRTTTSA